MSYRGHKYAKQRQDTGNRIPLLGEVRDMYLRAGTEPPQLVAVERLQRFADLAHIAIAGSVVSENDKHWLKAMTRYELGQAQQVEAPGEAASSYLKAIKSIHQISARSAAEELRANRFMIVTRLLYARLDESERQSRLQQIGAVRDLGQLIVCGAEVLPKASKQVRVGMYGELAEAAVTATLLAHFNNHRTHIAAPATDRQDRPRIGSRIDHTNTISAIQTIRAADINLTAHEGTDLDWTDISPLQVKSHFEGASGHYDATVPVIYADRDLDIDNTGQMEAYGRALTHFSGSSSQALRTAWRRIGKLLADREPLLA